MGEQQPAKERGQGHRLHWTMVLAFRLSMDHAKAKKGELGKRGGAGRREKILSEGGRVCMSQTLLE